MSGATWALGFSAIDATRQNSFRPFLGTDYRLTVDDIERAAVSVKAGTMRASFTLPLAGLAPGWHRLRIVCPSGETCPPWWAYVAGASAQAAMPAQLDSYGLYHRGTGLTFKSAIVPAVFDPVLRPYPARETPAFSTSLGRAKLIQEDLVPWRPFGLYRPRRTAGVLHTANEQPYYFATMVTAQSAFPALALLDGPRGRGNAAMVTHLQVGRNGGVYFCDPWRLGHIQLDGSIRTLAGWRHVGIPATELGEGIELVGDWSAVPAERRGFHELWGMAWDTRTVVKGTGAPIPNPPNGDEPPHDGNPVCFVADAQRNRVCRIEFDGKSHDSPAKVSEFLVGLRDPWDVVYADGSLYVSERQANRICAYDARTGEFQRVVVSGAAGLASVEPTTRFIRRLGSLDAIRAQPCVLPEGLFVLDGFLYFGSIAMGQVRKIDLATGAMTVAVKDLFYSFSFTNFCKICVSDGTVGPRGTVFPSIWLDSNAGLPSAYLPDGAVWDFTGKGETKAVPGRPWETRGYTACSAVGLGRLICGHSSEGISVISQALPTDGLIAQADWDRMTAAWEGRGLQLTHGPGGWGYYGLALPWGLSEDIDSYLKAHGHLP